MTRRLTILLIGGMLALAVVLGVAIGARSYVRRLTDHRNLGSQNALLGARITQYVLEKAIDNGLFDRDTIFRTRYEQVQGQGKPRYRTDYDLFFDRDVVKILKAFQEDDDIYYAYVINNDGFIPAHTDSAMSKTRSHFLDADAPEDAASGAPYYLPVRGEGGHSFSEFRAPILVHGQPWGEFRVGIPVALAKHRGREIFLGTFFITLLFAILVVVAVGYLVRCSLRPLCELTQATREMAAGKVSIRCNYCGNDELGTLAQSFNAMAETIFETQEGLERQVQERTAELARTNEDMLIEIAERRRAEQQLQTYATAIEASNHALEQSNRRAEQAARAKSEFLANMSHEIRTPMNGVIGMTELLRDTTLDSRQRAFVEACHSSGRVLLSLINDILDFSKIEAGKLDLEKRDFDLGAVVDETVEAMSHEAGRKGLQLVCHIAPQARQHVSGDDVRLRQVLLNLLGNAVKFTEKGEVAVTVELAESTAGNPQFRFEVSDSGIGIPADRIHRLFQSFSQADSSTTRKYGGTGLGLAISKNLVELMGGQIGVKSQPGHGSTFWFTVPLASSGVSPSHKCGNSRTASARNHQPDAVLRGRRVLLAEDNHVNRMYAEEVLRRNGMECQAVESGLQTIVAARSGRFDLVLMDCQMPGMDGFEVTRRIRAMERGGKLSGHLPIIALTANAVKGDREQCLAAGMDGYLGKPFEPETLIETMRRILTAAGPAQTSQAATNAVPVVPAASDSQSPIDQQALLARCMGNVEFAQSLLADFEGDLLERVGRVAQRLCQGDPRGAAELAHALKGAAGTVTAEPLRMIAAQIETASKSGSVTKAVALVEQLRAEAQRCLAFIPQLQTEIVAPCGDAI